MSIIINSLLSVILFLQLDTVRVYINLCFQAEVEKSNSELQRGLDEEQAKFELQTTVLNENLTTIRGDLVTTQKQLEEVSKSNDELRGEKLGMFNQMVVNTKGERKVICCM